MNAIRSVLFNILFYFWVFVPATLLVWVCVFPTRTVFRCVRAWQNGLGVIERVVMGIRYEVKGIENIPPGPCIIAAKHQSAWETCKLHVLIDEPAIVLKEELTHVPIWGWYAKATEMIPVDRGKGASALVKMMAAATAAKDKGRKIVLFPQGTRLRPGVRAPYKVGVAALYQAMKLPVVPMALNSGLYWPKGDWRRKPGLITVEFLPAIPAHLSRAEMMRRLEHDLEQASDRLAGLPTPNDDSVTSG